MKYLYLQLIIDRVQCIYDLVAMALLFIVYATIPHQCVWHVYIITGVWPESPSFADRLPPTSGSPEGALMYGPKPDHWKGTCQTGTQWNESHCK
jgi:hypothetical protein